MSFSIKFLLTALILLTIEYANACSTLCFNRENQAPLYAQNYDWDFGDGMVMTNPMGITRIALQKEQPWQWKSKLASITFNQYGSGFPISGMNEKGVTIATLWLTESEYPPKDERKELNILQWIQYQLDMSATVEEVIDSLEEVRVGLYAPGINLHYFISDATGDSAAIEFLYGEPVIRRGESLPYPALTNHTYDKSQSFYESVTGTVYKPEDVKKRDSLNRFALAVHELKEASPAASREVAFEALDQVAHPERTQWSVVFDIQEKAIHWKTKENPEFRHITFSDFNLTDGKAVLASDVDEGEGHVAKNFEILTVETNRDLVERSFRQTRQGGLSHAPPQIIDEVAYTGMPDAHLRHYSPGGASEE